VTLLTGAGVTFTFCVYSGPARKQFYGKRWGRGAHSTGGMCYDAPATGFFGLTGIASKPRSISSRMVSFLDAMRFAGCSSAAKGS
jgi:hypothetical protein